jgi:hypothetical protein
MMDHPYIRLELARVRGAELAASASWRHSAQDRGGDRVGVVRRGLAALADELLDRRAPAPADPAAVDVRIRFALAEDAAALRRLAALEGCPVPPPPLLVAEVHGELHAALSLWDGRAVADPFHRTQALVELLAVRAGQLRAASADLAEAQRRGRTWRPLAIPRAVGR